MPQYSVRVSEELGERIEAYADEYDGSKSDALRDLLDRGTEYDRIQRENDRLQRAQTQLIGQREENQELVAFASERRSMLEADRRLRNLRRAAPIWRKVWWSIFGEPIDPETGERT